MENITVTAQKDSRGNWKAENSFDLGLNHILAITTRKASNGSLVTTASVSIAEDSGFLTHRVYTDYSKQLLSRKYARITKNNVIWQQEEVLGNLDAIKIEALDYYIKLEAQ